MDILFFAYNLGIELNIFLVKKQESVHFFVKNVYKRVDTPFSICYNINYKDRRIL